MAFEKNNINAQETPKTITLAELQFQQINIAFLDKTYYYQVLYPFLSQYDINGQAPRGVACTSLEPSQRRVIRAENQNSASYAD